MNVTITGPNAHGGMFHVHATGCADLARGVYRTIRPNIERYEEEHASVQSVVEDVYSDIIAENDGELATWEPYASEFQFFPCVNGLPELTVHEHKAFEADNCPRCGTAQRRMGQ